MSDKKTIKEALAEVQKNAELMEGPNPFGLFSKLGRGAAKAPKSAPRSPMPHGGEDLVGKAKSAKEAPTIDLKAETPKSSVSSTPAPKSSGLKDLGKAALGAGAGAAAGYGAYKGYEAFTKDKGPVGPSPEKFTKDEPKAAETPKTPEAPKAAETKMTFGQAYAKAREAAKAAGKNPNIAQFKFDRGGGEKVYQAAATKKDYVPMGKQYKVDIGSTKAAATPSVPEAPKAAETPKIAEPSKQTTTATPPKEDTGVAARRDIRQGSQDVLGAGLDVIAGKSGAGERLASGASQFVSGMGQAASHAKNVIQGAAGAASERLGKNAQPEYESGKRKKMSEENEINELSPFERTFAQKIKQLGPGKTYRDPTTGKDILLKYAENKPHTAPKTGISPAPKPQSSISPGNVPTPPRRPQMGPPDTTWRDPAKIDYSKDNKAKPETLPSTVRGSAQDPARDAARDTHGGEKGVYSDGGRTHSLQGTNVVVPTTNRDAAPRPSTPAPSASSSSMLSGTPVAQQRTLDKEYESGGKKKKMSEESNPLIAAFLNLQDKNPANMFEAAKKLSKKQDEKLDVVDDDKIDAKDFAALRAGKKHVEEGSLPTMAKPSANANVRQVTTDFSAPDRPAITKTKPAEDPSLPKTYPGAASTIKGPNPTSAVMSRIAKEEVEINELDDDTMRNAYVQAKKRGKSDQAMRIGNMLGKRGVSPTSDKVANPFPVHREEVELDEMRDRPKKDDVNRRKRDAVAMKLGHDNPEGRNNNYNAPVSMLKHGRKLMQQGVTKEETEVTFTQEEIDHINSFFLEASVAPTRPEVATGADSTSDKMSQNDVTATAESGKKLRKEEVELDEAKKKLQSFEKMMNTAIEKRKSNPQKHEIIAPVTDRSKTIRYTGDAERLGLRKEEVELDEDSSTISDAADRRKYIALRNMEADSFKKAKASSSPLKKDHHNKMANQHNDAANEIMDKYRSKSNKIQEETLEEGRPKKNPTPETTERDPRKHIQVEAGRAAAGNVVDFTHNDGSKSKITPAMGRKIVSHLNGLKPADRQTAVNRMHDSAEGLKV